MTNEEPNTDGLINRMNLQSGEGRVSAPTPGPWFELAGEDYVYASNGMDDVAVAQPLGDTQEQAKANGRLIAAAPELLKVADDLLWWVAFVKSTPELEAVKSAAKAAIAKATTPPMTAENPETKGQDLQPWTDHWRAVADALSRCTFLPGSHDKRFARDMVYASGLAKPRALTERQAAHLTRLAWKYRRQMPPALVRAPAEPPPPRLVTQTDPTHDR